MNTPTEEPPPRIGFHAFLRLVGPGFPPNHRLVLVTIFASPGAPFSVAAIAAESGKHRTHIHEAVRSLARGGVIAPFADGWRTVDDVDRWRPRHASQARKWAIADRFALPEGDRPRAASPLAPARRRPHIGGRLRTAVFERDAYRCRHCGDHRGLQVDHVVPFSRGGSSGIDNLQTLCRPCNAKKSDGPEGTP